MEKECHKGCRLSVIIPTYNRKELVSQSIDSALQFSANMASTTEIIVVDDASRDATYELLQGLYQEELFSGVIRLIRSEKNLGVTGAKNLGAANAKGEWLLFLDSDDLLIPDAAHDFLRAIKTHSTCPFILFRCVELRTGKMIGAFFREPYDLTLRGFLNDGTPGECLPVVKASVFAQNPYRADLRGCEGLTYAEIIKKFGPCKVETLVARRYRTENMDRLSARKNLMNRSCHIAEYHCAVLRNHFSKFCFTTMIETFLKLSYFWVHCVLQRKHRQ